MDLMVRLMVKFLSGAVEREGNNIQGYLAHEKHPTPYDHHRALGMGLL